MGYINDTGLTEFTTKIKAYLQSKLGGITEYTITTSVTNGTYSGSATILQNSTASVTVSASAGYNLPSSITVVGATYTYDSSTGVISLSNPTDNVSITVVCEAVQPQEEYFLTFSSADSFSIYVIDNVKYWDGTLEYSTDKTTWNTWSGTNMISSASDGTKYNLYLRGIGNTILTGAHVSNAKRWIIFRNTTVSISGNIETLLDYATVALGNHPPMSNRCYQDLFRANESTFSSGPDIDASNLVLGALTGTANCYQYMFAYSSITKAPKIMLTSLQNYSCYSMFNDCQKLSTIPKIYVKDFSYTQCCYQMFNSCSLIKISQTQTGEYVNEYAVPITKDGTSNISGWNSQMFRLTGGTFTNEPTMNTTYYTSNEVV